MACGVRVGRGSRSGPHRRWFPLLWSCALFLMEKRVKLGDEVGGDWALVFDPHWNLWCAPLGFYCSSLEKLPRTIWLHGIHDPGGGRDPDGSPRRYLSNNSRVQYSLSTTPPPERQDFSKRWLHAPITLRPSWSCSVSHGRYACISGCEKICHSTAARL